MERFRGFYDLWTFSCGTRLNLSGRNRPVKLGRGIDVPNVTQGTLKRHAGGYSWETIVGATGGKIGFYSVTPVAHPTGADQAAVTLATDLLFDPTLGLKQGEFLARLKRWFTPHEAMKMATSGNAELLKMSGPRTFYPADLGVVKDGAYADLILWTAIRCRLSN
jgi:hypothetical protein